MGINYKWLNEQYQAKAVKELPDGEWLKVSEAAKFFGVTRQTVRHRYLQQKLYSLDYMKHIHVRVDSFPDAEGS